MDCHDAITNTPLQPEGFVKVEIASGRLFSYEAENLATTTVFLDM